MQRPDGALVTATIISNPFPSNQKSFHLLLSSEAIALLDQVKYSALTFMGGYTPIKWYSLIHS